MISDTVPCAHAAGADHVLMSVGTSWLHFRDCMSSGDLGDKSDVLFQTESCLKYTVQNRKR